MILFSIQLWSINRWLRWTGFRIGIMVDLGREPGLRPAHDAKELQGRKPTLIVFTWYGFKGWRQWE